MKILFLLVLSCIWLGIAVIASALNVQDVESAVQKASDYQNEHLLNTKTAGHQIHDLKSQEGANEEIQSPHKVIGGHEKGEKISHEDGGSKHKNVAHGKHHSLKNSQSAHAQAGKFHEGKAKKRVNVRKGFKEEHHKNEQKKHATFYSNRHKSGEFEVYGNKHSNFATNLKTKKHTRKSGGARSAEKHSKKSAKSTGHESGGAKSSLGHKGAKSHHQSFERRSKKSSKPTNMPAAVHK